uniref:Uncharacterized protein n=1 Tax=Spongospora subterranea TaxID=70186 RepID=A0A0H5QMY3_9EUKA|eukprot:CRZ03333.1 hypothetical protein [Spongospora subterranea]
MAVSCKRGQPMPVATADDLRDSFSLSESICMLCLLDTIALAELADVRLLSTCCSSTIPPSDPLFPFKGPPALFTTTDISRFSQKDRARDCTFLHYLRLMYFRSYYNHIMTI